SGRRWNAAFSPVQVGKDHLYAVLRGMGLVLHLREGWQTKQLRDQYGLTKSTRKDQRTFSSHAVDAWALAASVSGAAAATGTRLWYVIPIQLHRRQLHRLQAERGGVSCGFIADRDHTAALHILRAGQAQRAAAE